MPTWIVPSDTHNAGDTGHTTDHNHIADDLTLLAWASSGLAPSGDTTGATDQAAITAAEARGQAVFFQPGTFYVTGLVKQAGTIWHGAGGWRRLSSWPTARTRT